MKNLKPGTEVQVTYQGKNAGRGYTGKIKDAYKWHSLTDNDCYDIETQRGIDHGVPEAIVTPVEKYTLYFHVDESANAFTDGEYTWQHALSRKDVLLKYYPSVTLNGIRYYADYEKGSQS